MSLKNLCPCHVFLCLIEKALFLMISMVKYNGWSFSFLQIRGWKAWEEETSSHGYEFANGMSSNSQLCVRFSFYSVKLPSHSVLLFEILLLLHGTSCLYWAFTIFVCRCCKIQAHSWNIIRESPYQFLDKDFYLLLYCEKPYLTNRTLNWPPLWQILHIKD